jgi:hypothetical protein
MQQSSEPFGTPKAWSRRMPRINFSWDHRYPDAMTIDNGFWPAKWRLPGPPTLVPKRTRGHNDRNFKSAALASNGQQKAAVDSKNILISQFPAVIWLGPIGGRIFRGVPL